MVQIKELKLQVAENMKLTWLSRMRIAMTYVPFIPAVTMPISRTIR